MVVVIYGLHNMDQAMNALATDYTVVGDTCQTDLLWLEHVTSISSK